MFDDTVVVLGKAEFAQRVVERPSRGDEKHGDVQPAAGIWRFLLGHPVSSTQSNTGTPPSEATGLISRAGCRPAG